MSEATKEDFQRVFGHGYTEDFLASGYADFKLALPALVSTHAIGKVAVDIGCGSGKLTIDWLVPLFDKVYALDVVKRTVPEHPKIEYIEVPSQNYSCYGVPSDSVDFVFSLGCFCHLINSANQEYLHNVYRVLKRGGKAVLVYANWLKHPSISKDEIENARVSCRETSTGCGWCYMDESTLNELAVRTPFVIWKNLFPSGRDLIALFQKE